jgi:hypothetical protein
LARVKGSHCSDYRTGKLSLQAERVDAVLVYRFDCLARETLTNPHLVGKFLSAHATFLRSTTEEIEFAGGYRHYEPTARSIVSTSDRSQRLERFYAASILYAPMPYVLERALYEVYEDRGWDLGVGRHPDEDPRSGVAPPLAFPTLTDLYHKVGQVVDRLGYEDRIRMDVTAGLQARVDSLRVGQKGQTLDCRRSVPFAEILEKPTILELSHLGSDDEKAFLIGLLLMRLYEHLELAGESPHVKHLTLIEEAHRCRGRRPTPAPPSQPTSRAKRSKRSAKSWLRSAPMVKAS